MKRLIDFKERFNTLEKGQVAVLISDGKPQEFVYRHRENGHLCIYMHIFSHKDLDEDAEFWDKAGEFADDTSVLVTDYAVFSAIVRKSNKDHVEDYLTIEDSNASKIAKKVEEDGGKIVYDNDKYLILLGAVASDEDYYYVYLDEKLKVSYTTCVGKYELPTEEQESEDYAYYDMQQFRYRLMEDKGMQCRTKLNVIEGLMGGSDVLFTKLHIPGVENVDLTNFNAQDFVVSE